MDTASDMKISALASWFGGNRTLAPEVGKQLGRLAWCGVPFLGGGPELAHIDCRAGVANDLHRHVINLARCVRFKPTLDAVVERLETFLFHPDELAAAQKRCAELDHAGGLFGGAPEHDVPDPELAADYFASVWMTRGGNAGKEGEFSQGIATRFSSGGGASVTRWRSAVESLAAWHRVLQRWEFDRVDALGFLATVRNDPGHGLYVDAPWPDLGEGYKHPFSDGQQRKLARMLAVFNRVRIVVRFGDHPLIRELYPEGPQDGPGPGEWAWLRQKSANQQGGDVQEVLLVNGRIYGGPDRG